MNETEKRLNTLFDKLVPDSGKADTVAGEIIRAISHIGYRNWNDGDHLGIWCGEETVNPAARYLAAKCDSGVNSALAATWGIDDDAYSKKLEAVKEAVLAYLDAHPELETGRSAGSWTGPRQKGSCARGAGMWGRGFAGIITPYAEDAAGWSRQRTAPKQRVVVRTHRYSSIRPIQGGSPVTP